MNQLVVSVVQHAPAIIAAAGDRASYRFIEFFIAQIRNPNTRRAYVRSVGEFCIWIEQQCIPPITNVSSVHVATYIEKLCGEVAAPTVKHHLAAIRMIFD